MRMKPQLGRQLRYGHPLSRGLIGCWLMNEGGGNTVFDLSGNNYRGTKDAGYSWVGGKYGPAILGDNTNGHYIIAACPQNTPGDLAVFGGCTLIVSAKLNSDVSSLVGRNNTAWMWTHTTNNRLYCRINSNNDALVVDNGALYDGLYHNYAFTYDDGPNNGYAYRDGVQIGSVAGHGFNMTSSSDSWYIGEDPRDGTGLPLNGAISHVYIYNRALSASEIAELYRNPFCMFEYDEWPLFVGAMGGLVPMEIYVYDTDEEIGNVA